MQSAQPRPSLIPADVWVHYQAELAQRSTGLHEVGDPTTLEVVPAEPLVGLGSTVRADLEVAVYALGSTQLFEGLPQSVLLYLARSARQGELREGDYLFREEAEASSFFVVLDGSVEVLRRMEGREVALRHLERGEPVGLFGLLAGRQRAACARAIGDAMLLEFPRQALDTALAHDEQLRGRILKFYEERLLEAFLGSSRLLADVDAIARARIIGRFTERKVRGGESLVEPGEVSNLLAVVISGALTLETRARAAEAPVRFELYPGEFAAVTSALSGAPCRGRLYAQVDTTLVVLPHAALAELLRDYPALRVLKQRLAAQAREVVRDLWCGATGVTGL
jgi:CRP/FNR family transcriptional regulator, cyclic AMP receptor protein